MNMGSPKKGDETLHKYGRDFLLQLRMHPLSLQKPPNLPHSDIVKDRLYLHQLENIGSQGADEFQQNSYSAAYRAYMKSDNSGKFTNQRSYPGYVPRNCSYYAPTQKYNSVSPYAKYRSSFNSNYYNPLQKQLYRASTAYKADLSTEDFYENVTELQSHNWFKETFPMYAPENDWNLSEKGMLETKSPTSMNENARNNPKSKKKLSIINPETGKNILEEICEDSQSSLSSKENTEDETKTISSETVVNGVEDVVDHGENYLSEVGRDFDQPGVVDEDFSYMNMSSKQSGDNAFLSFNHDCPEEEFLREYSSCKHSSDKKRSTSKSVESGDSEKNLNESLGFSTTNEEKEGLHSSLKEIPEGDGARDASKVPQNISPHFKGSKTFSSQNTYATDSEMSEQEGNVANLREKIMMLRYKLYSMDQEQQKMAILQSFLRFKKHQLDESLQILDEKKIENVNWEYNLFLKAKKLHEKECWLEVKIRNLKKKEKQLEEKEKWLNMRETEMGNSKSVPKNYSESLMEPNLKEDMIKCEVIKSEVDNKKLDETSEVSAMVQKQSKDKAYGDVREISAKQSIGKGNELPLNTNISPNQKMASEGRKYFPEHIKYWLNHRDIEMENYKNGVVTINENVDNKKQDGRSDVGTMLQYQSRHIASGDVSATLKKQSKAKTSELPSSTKTLGNQKMTSEGRKYLPEHIKYWLNQREIEVERYKNDSKKDHANLAEIMVKENGVVATGEVIKSYPGGQRQDGRSEVSIKSEGMLQQKIHGSEGFYETPKQSKAKNNELPSNIKSSVSKMTSEGRKYFPESIKYMLNQKDKKLLDGSVRKENEVGQG